MNNWIMTVPVLSMAHMPEPEALHRLDEPVAFLEENEGFVRIEDGGPDEGHWLYPIWLWMMGNGLRDQWVRFADVGDTIIGLPVFPWAEE